MVANDVDCIYPAGTLEIGYSFTIDGKPREAGR